ncbi:hypothetical protein TKK_0007887 [Trichogramma kaykai]
MLPQYNETEFRERVNDQYDEYNFNVAEVVEIDSSADDVELYEVHNDCLLLGVDQRISPRAPAADLYFDSSQGSALIAPEKGNTNFFNKVNTDFPRIDGVTSYHDSSSVPELYQINSYSSNLQEIDRDDVVALYSSENLNKIVQSFDDNQNESMFDEFISPISSDPLDVDFSLSNGSTAMPPQNDIYEIGIFPKYSTLVEETTIKNSFLEKANFGSLTNNNEKEEKYLFDNDAESCSKSFSNLDNDIHFEHCNIPTERTNQEETRIHEALTASPTLSPSATQKSSPNTIDLSDSPMNEETKKTKNGNAKILAIYPKPPAKGGICITSEDYMCLAAGEYLNDIIIDFYLKYVQEEVLSPKDRDRTHIFSSHFYTRLAKVPDSVNGCEDISLAEKRYAGVHRWTKNINIFEKDFVIVPINQHFHWYLAIICFPGLILVDNQEVNTNIEKSCSQQRPCILIFDSLSSAVKSKVTRLLKEYLQLECAYKINREKAHKFNSIKTFYPVSPKQTNATDCGLYMLQYVESFFEDPIIQFSSPIRNLSKWFYKSKVIDKRREIAEIITLLMIDFHDGQSIDLPTINFSDELSESFCDNSNLSPYKNEFDSEAKKNNLIVDDDDGIEIFVPKSNIASSKNFKLSKSLFEEHRPIKTNDRNKLKLRKDNFFKSGKPDIVENVYTTLRNKKKTNQNYLSNQRNLNHSRENCSRMMNYNKDSVSSLKGNSFGNKRINASSCDKKSYGISDQPTMIFKPIKRRLYTETKSSEPVNISPITQDKFYNFDFDRIKNESGIPHTSSFNTFSKTFKIKKKEKNI